MHDVSELADGTLHWFADWPVRHVPTSGSIVYTIWDRAGAFIYVGMAGRSTSTSAKSKGPFGRLESHANGRRSGDQFNVYICDRFVLPRVHNRITEIAEGRLSLDLLTREFIRAELGFRFIAVTDPAEAFLIERCLQRGEWEAGRPILNPIGSSSLLLPPA
ncbi:hypothetical protein [Methylobacterium sp. WSM2598]|uniref:hypothetical protein n=1 Tax=Methylobacterium sp. WSM2598 TaxID=398261 RepID=UPI0003614B0F|nr:hypothetical protein [Methylobacterium sp. WSM2598]